MSLSQNSIKQHFPGREEQTGHSRQATRSDLGADRSQSKPGKEAADVQRDSAHPDQIRKELTRNLSFTPTYNGLS